MVNYHYCRHCPCCGRCDGCYPHQQYYWTPYIYPPQPLIPQPLYHPPLYENINISLGNWRTARA